MSQCKICSACQVSKPDEEFNFRNKRLGVRQNQCRYCTRAASKSHYTKNKAPYLAKAESARRVYKANVVAFLRSYLSSHPCVDCGETEIVVLEFDHVRGHKASTIQGLMRNNRPLKVIENEIAKCDVRCANCHRRATAARNGRWWKLSL